MILKNNPIKTAVITHLAALQELQARSVTQAILSSSMPSLSVLAHDQRGRGAMRPQLSNQVQYVAPTPINQARQSSQPLYIAPAPQQQPVTIQQPQPAPIGSGQMIIMPTLPSQPIQASSVIVIDAMPIKKDWTGEITAVGRSLALVVDVVPHDKCNT
jgi:hypothetical protein